LNIARKINVE